MCRSRLQFDAVGAVGAPAAPSIRLTSTMLIQKHIASHFDAATVSAAAEGRQLEILQNVAGIPSGRLDGKHHACPQCGGKDRFRLIDRARGAVLCNQCFSTKNGDSFAAVQWMRSVEFPEALRLVADFLGLTETPATPIDPLTAIAREKHVSADALKSFGAVVHDGGVGVPAYGPDGEVCSWFLMRPEQGKGLFAKGHPAGVFLPTENDQPRLPQPGEEWCMVEGPKDAPALGELGRLAIGTPTSSLPAKFNNLLRGVHLTIVPDRDQPSVDGAAKTARVLKGVAASVKVAALPAELRETGGQDVRDILRQPDGAKLVEQAIVAAVPVDGFQPAVEITYQRITSGELEQGDYSIEYLIDGVLVDLQPAVIGGGYKTLKTSIAADLALSIAFGGRFLGVFDVPVAHRVVVMSGESGLATLQETARRICRAAGRRLRDASVIWSPDLPRFDSEPHMDALRRFLTDDEATVCIVDPAYLAMGGNPEDHKNVFAIGERLRSVGDACMSVGVTPIICHHAKRAKSDNEPMELGDLAFSGWAEWARQWILLNRRERFDPDSNGEHNLWMTVGGSAGHFGLWGLDITEGRQSDPGGRSWDVEIIPASDARATSQTDRQRQQNDQKKAKFEADCELVTLKLNAATEPLTAKRLMAQCHFGADRLQRAIEQLLTDQRIQETKVCVSNHNKPTTKAFILVREGLLK